MTDEQASLESIKTANNSARSRAYTQLRDLTRNPGLLRSAGYASLEAALVAILARTEKEIEARIVAHERRFPMDGE